MRTHYFIAPKQVVATGVMIVATVQARNSRLSCIATHRDTQHYLDSIAKEQCWTSNGLAICVDLGEELWRLAP